MATKKRIRESRRKAPGEKFKAWGNPNRQRDAERALRERITGRKCELCKIRPVRLAADGDHRYCSSRCNWTAARVRRGLVTQERAEILVRQPVGLVAQTAREQIAQRKAKAAKHVKFSEMGKKGGAATARRGREYFAALGRIGGKLGKKKGKTWLATKIPDLPAEMLPLKPGPKRKAT